MRAWGIWGKGGLPYKERSGNRKSLSAALRRRLTGILPVGPSCRTTDSVLLTALPAGTNPRRCAAATFVQDMPSFHICGAVRD